MHDVGEKFIDTNALIDRLDEIGLGGNRQKIWRWMKLDNPIPYYRPGGPPGKVYFLWSEVLEWLRTACFFPPPGDDEEDGDEEVA